MRLSQSEGEKYYREALHDVYRELTAWLSLSTFKMDRSSPVLPYAGKSETLKVCHQIFNGIEKDQSDACIATGRGTFLQIVNNFLHIQPGLDEQLKRGQP